MNITNDKITEYIRSFSPEKNQGLEALREQCIEERIPLILPETREFIRVLLSITKPSGILEIGTAWGYSSAFFAMTLKDVWITTIEKSQRTASRASFNHRKLGVSSRISIITGDGADILRYMNEMRMNPDAAEEELLHRVKEDPETAFAGAPASVDDPEWEPDIMTTDRIEQIKEASERKYDFLFIDAAKSHYREFFDQGMSLLEPGSVILCDNVLMKASVIDSDYDGHRRHRTNVKRMTEFLDYINSRDDMVSSIISCGDGLALIKMKD